MGAIIVKPADEFKYIVEIDNISGYINEKSTVAFIKIDKGFRIEYYYDSFAEYGKHKVSIKVIQCFEPENEVNKMEIYLCYIGIMEDLKKVGEIIYLNEELRPEFKIHTFDEVEKNIPSL